MIEKEKEEERVEEEGSEEKEGREEEERWEGGSCTNTCQVPWYRTPKLLSAHTYLHKKEVSA